MKTKDKNTKLKRRIDLYILIYYFCPCLWLRVVAGLQECGVRPWGPIWARKGPKRAQKGPKSPLFQGAH